MTLRASVAIAISCIAACLGLGLSASASAQEAEEKEEEGKREAPTIDLSTGKRLNEAIEALNAQKYEEAKAALSKMNLEKLSPYEKSRVYQMYASIAGAQNDYDGVRKNMQLAISSGGLNDEENRKRGIRSRRCTSYRNAGRKASTR